ncbi:hypothetical protein CYMTET_2708 [Cymbomonas tetramitiformis]|uniref:CDP-diacylglycerol--serine O-phosphatidyltransferase n=1 Tax=Cymbomonas tetramitiformis TaxID=36881 RepID=A0AAE0H4Q6_9CHLO|nr:hypothetical protein CYMTET_2708 [Cymbomonas tetramitiformis]
MGIRQRKPSSHAEVSKKTASKLSQPGEKAPSAQIVEEDFLDFLYRPHTLLGLFLALAFLVWSAFFREATTIVENFNNGLCAIAVVFLSYCALQLPDGLLRRPHPVLWRIVQGCAILYLLFLVFILQFDVNTARENVMPMFDATLGVVPEANTKTYASDCRLITPEDPGKGWANLVDAVFDMFFVAHVVGWWGKAILFRDWTICWILSIMWEVLEVSLQHQLPNFKECWWDHYLLDVFGCNLVGMIIGMWTVKHYAHKEYNWTGIKEISNVRGKVGRVLKQFSPFSWTNYEWAALSSPQRFGQVMLLLVMQAVGELNAFYIKHVLWLPPPFPLNTVRLIMLWLIMFPAVREYYAYIQDRGRHRMGSALWVTCAICITEFIVVVKFSLQDPMMYSRGQADAVHVPSVAQVALAWQASGVIFAIWFVLHFGLRSICESSRIMAICIDMLLLISVAPLLVLLGIDFMDTWNQ